MDRKWFRLRCRADLADHFLKGIDNFPDNVFDTQRFSANGAVLEIHDSYIRESSYLIYPNESERKFFLTIRTPQGAESVESPPGRGILFRVNDQNYYVFSTYKEGFEFGRAI